MKTKSIYFPEIQKDIHYLIGQNAHDNFLVIDEGLEDDIWFHSKDSPSCHVVCLLPNDLILSEKERQNLIEKGAELCVFYTNKLTLLYNIPIIYTEIKNIKKTKIAGLVKTSYTKTIIVKNNNNLQLQVKVISNSTQKK